MKHAKEACFVHGRSDFCDDVSACCDSIFDLDQLTFKVHHVVTSSTFGGKESMFNFFLYRVSIRVIVCIACA